MGKGRWGGGNRNEGDPWLNNCLLIVRLLIEGARGRRDPSQMDLKVMKCLGGIIVTDFHMTLFTRATPGHPMSSDWIQQNLKVKCHAPLP